MITYAEACERVVRYLRAVGYPDNVHVYSSKEYDTHWIIVFAVPSLEGSSRVFMYGEVVAEKQTGYLYRKPSRLKHPADSSSIPSIRRESTRITIEDLEKLENEKAARS